MTRALHIVHALCSNRIGGLEQAYINTTFALRRLGHHVSAWVPDDAPYLTELPCEVPHELFNPRGFYDVYGIYKARKKLKKQKIDLIITHNSRATSILSKARLGLDVPQLAFSHSYKYKRMKGADRLVVLTPHMAQHFTDKGLGAKKLHILPNMFIDLPAQPLPLPTIKTEIRLGFIGKMTIDKGILDLLEALVILRNQGNSCRLHIAGIGNDAQQAIQKIKQLKLDIHVQFDGWVTDVRGWLAEIDLVVIPSHHEPFGIVVMEAQAHGRPVVSTFTGGPSSQIIHGTSGWLANPADPQSLANTIAQAIKQRDIWPKIITAAYESSKRYHIENILPQLEKILELLKVPQPK